MSVTKSHYICWAILYSTSCGNYYWLHRILCSIVVSSTSWKQYGEGTGDVSLSVKLVDRSSTAGLGGHDTVGVAARWRNCRLCTDCLMCPAQSSVEQCWGQKKQRGGHCMGLPHSVLMAVPRCRWLR